MIKVLELQLQHQSFKWMFRVDLLYDDLLAVQGTLISLLQHHSSKALILWCSAFFTVQLSHPYVTTGTTIALMRWTFVRKVCFCFLICYLDLSMAFLPRSKHLLVSWLQSPSAGPRERSSDLHKSLSQTCLWVFECLLQRHRSTVTYHGDRGSGCSRPGWCGMWQKSFWRRAPLAPL